MLEFKANERTFQGVLLSTFNSILEDSPGIKFDSAFQELNVGVDKKLRDTPSHGDVAGLIRPEINYNGNNAWSIIKKVIIERI